MKNLLIFFSGVVIAAADQPIMNMMPRWDEGYGFQVIQEFRTESELLDGGDEVGDGLTEFAHITHLEGVYTWDRSIRLTAKLPYVLSAEREVLDSVGNKQTQKDSGIGDLTLALPLKRYFNETDKSGSWTLAPQLRVPLASKDDYDIYDRVWGVGLYTGYEQETQKRFIALGVGAWFFEGDEPEEIHAHLDLGWNFNTKGQLLWESDVHYESDSSRTLSMGPALYYRFTDLVHTRLEWKFDVLDYQGKIDHGEGNTVKAGVGFVW